MPTTILALDPGTTSSRAIVFDHGETVRGVFDAPVRLGGIAEDQQGALAGIAFPVADILDVMKQDSALAMNELRVDGAAAAKDLRVATTVAG